MGVVVWSRLTQDVVQINQEARRILGASPEENQPLEGFLDQIGFMRLDGSPMPRNEWPIAKALRGGATVRAEEMIIRNQNGMEVTALANATPIYRDDGELASVVATLQDITPLEELERMRSEFLGMVSHELRAPLTSIKGSAATVRTSSSPLDPAETRQFFRIIEEQADHMRDLINNLLDLTRIEAGTLSVALEPADVATVIKQAVNAFSSSGHQNNVEVAPVALLPRVWADKQRLVQVLLNLMSNASKYSRDFSTIRVSARLEDLYVAVSVTDEGTGIPAELLSDVFSKFSQTPGDGRTDGSGLGLAICKGIVEAHGGRIWAESRGKDHGTRFTFTVPTVDEGAALLSNPVADADGARQTAVQGERILAIDDNPQTLRFIRNTLSEAGYTPIMTGDPDEIEHLLRTEKPHLVLLNLVLPGTDGFELMKRHPKILGVPVIIVSGRGGDQYVAQAFEMGASDYMVKPFSPTELLTRISAALRRQTRTLQDEPFRVADLMVDYVTRRVTVGGSEVQLTPTEFKLLSELCTNAGRVLTYEHLLARVWGEDPGGDLQRVRTFVKDLRRKLGDPARNSRYIVTAPKVGYSCVSP